MKVLSAQNADVTITRGGVAAATMISNVVMNADNRPAESDLPSGAWFIWPLKEGTLQLAFTLNPGDAPWAIRSGPVSPTMETIVVSCKDIGGATVTFTLAGYHTGLQVSTTMNEVGMPVLAQQVEYTILIDDAKETDYAH